MSLFRFLTPTRVAVAATGAAVAALLGLSAMADDEQIAQMPHGPGRTAQGQNVDRCQRLAEHLNQIDRKLTPDQVRDILAGRLAQSGQNTLKVGKVRTNGDVVSVDITTTSGSLVVTREISSKTGMPADLVKRCEDGRARRTAMMNRNGGPQNANAGPQSGADGDRGDGRHHDGGRGMHHRFGGHHHHMGRGFGGNGGFGAFALIGNVGQGRDLNLTADQTKKLADAAVVMIGNPRLKVGAVKEKDADTMTVDIVTQDNALVVRREVDRHTGRMKSAS